MSRSHDDITRVLREVHENLDRRVVLETLARRSGYSPFHFHRRFVESVGETPKQHLLRVRLERAAYLVAVTGERFLRLAFSVGFRSHETFTRAFRRHFGVSPTAYRRAARRAQAERLARDASCSGDGCLLSEIRFLTLPSARLLCASHTGAYSELAMPPFSEGDQLWRPILAWALAAGVAHVPTAWAISHDDPTLTPGPNQRLDACLPVQGAIPPGGPCMSRNFAGGRYAGVEHVGPHETISQAYRRVADGIRRSAAAFGTGPPVQIFRHLDPDPRHHRTEVYFPVVRR